MPPPVGPDRNEIDVFSIGFACGIIGDAQDGASLRGVLARVLGQLTYPDPAMLARTSEEDYKQAISDLGRYVDRSGAEPVQTPIGLMDKGRLLEFRARVIYAYKKSRGFREDAPPVAAKKVRLSTIVDGTAAAEVDLLSPERASD
eukprot:14732169-Alexandrium_andersonii.AAC.1